MVAVLIRKEILAHLLTARFALVFALQSTAIALSIFLMAGLKKPLRSSPALRSGRSRRRW
jgi:hypothetical protein